MVIKWVTCRVCKRPRVETEVNEDRVCNTCAQKRVRLIDLAFELPFSWSRFVRVFGEA